MWMLIAAASVLLIFLVLFDAFETILLPRRVTRHVRFARIFFVYSWGPWAAAARSIRVDKRRNRFLSWFGPLSVLVLLSLGPSRSIFGFALLHWALGTPLSSQPETAGLGIYSYFSGVTFFTLGYGDLTPMGGLGRFLAVAETGIGFGFFAVGISYLPVLYQAFSRREVTISLLDARAGSPPTAGTLLSRVARYSDAALGPVSGRVGTLGRRGPGEPCVVSNAELLSLAARQPVMAGCAHGHSRCFRVGHRAGTARRRRQRGSRSRWGGTWSLTWPSFSRLRRSSPRPIACQPHGSRCCEIILRLWE